VQRDNLTRDEAEARSRTISDVSYDIDLDLTTADSENTWRCEVLVRFRCAEQGSSTFLDYVAPAVDELDLNGTRQAAGAFDGSRIHLPNLAADNEVRIRSISAYSHSGVGLHRFRDPVDGELYLYSDFEPFDAHKVFPCFDQPDLKGRFRFSVLAPEGWEVASNMAPVGPPSAVDGGSSAVRWEFEASPPMSPYVTAVIAGPYHVVRDRHGAIDLGLYCRQSLATYLDPDEIFEITKQGFDFFERAFDYPYAFGKYDQAFVPEFTAGAMENPGLVTFHEQYIFRSRVTEAARERRAETILHEMAHMWFGDLVTMRWWDDLWLNESFATFISVLAQVRATRFTNGWVTFADSEKGWAYQQDQLPTTHPIVADVPETDAVHVNFDGITYAKGASVLKQLVAWVGEKEFLSGLRTYFRRHEFGNTDLGDFLSALEEASGRDLRAWSKEWLETAGLNTLRASFETTGEPEMFASFTVAQEAPPEWPILRPHRVAIGLYDLSGDQEVRRRHVELDVVGAATEVPELVGERVPDLVLVNDRDLAYASIRLDPRSLATVTEHQSTIADPLARALCWGACWSMVRDAEMPTRDYLAMVLSHAEAEDDVGEVQRLLRQAEFAIEYYGNPGSRDAYLDRLADEAKLAMHRAPSGGDHQLAWARAFISAARADRHLAALRGLLHGTDPVEGLTMDTELRWHIVRSLAASGYDEDALIDAELERDPTDAGRKHAAAARASRPTEMAKVQAWEEIVSDASLPTATISSLIEGFQRAGQRALLEPFAERYFAALKPFWAERDLEVALVFTRGMYPHVVVDQSTLGLTDGYLETQESPTAVRRFLLEGRDGIRRALLARASDLEAG
jgi:aminopeptidase N